MPLKILVVGAGIAGPALASLLQRSKTTRAHKIVVVERSPSLRLAGQQIDIKAQGIPILRKMDLLETIRAHCVAETGLEIIDGSDKMLATFGVTAADKKGFTLTSEYEIIRGDMVKVLYEDSLAQRKRVDNEGEKDGGLTYVFDKSLTELKQLDDGVDVTFSDGEKSRYDLVVAADGQGSRIRRLVFGQQASDAAFKSLGIHAAYFSIPRAENEGGLARMYFSPNCWLLTRTANRPITGANIFAKTTDSLKQSNTEATSKQKEAWADNIRNAGGQSARFISGLESCTDFYAHELGQIKMANLYKGRVVLLGDAGYCPSPFTGLGTTSALVGSYILAGELARCGDDVGAALKAYEDKVRAPIEENQKMPTGGINKFFPSSRLGVWVLNGVAKTIYTFGIDKILTRFMDDGESKGKGGWKMPEYEELEFAK